jgi:TonB family protein
MAYNSYLFEDALPWAVSESDRRFMGIVAISLFVSTLLYVIIQFLPKPVIEQKKLEDVSPRLAKLIIEKQAQPKPPPPVPQKKEPEKAKEKPKEPEKPKDKPKDKPKPKEKVPEPKPQPSPEQRADKAREKAAQSGLMAKSMQDQLADLRQSFNVASLQNQKSVTHAGATTAKENNDNTSSLIATKANQGSGGINTGGLSRTTGGSNLAGRDTTAVKSTINSSGGGKGRGAGGGGGSANSRGDEEIELVFQENKGNIFSIYNRYLRQDPTLKGKLVLQITIAPDGHVTNVRVVSSELKNPELEQKIVSRIKLFKFKPSNVDTVTVNYPIDFLPS